MDRESVERLRFDRRLHSRRGWVEESDIASHLESLQDVSDKMTTAAELEAEEAAASEAAEAETAPAPPAPPPAFGSQPPRTEAPQTTIGGPIGGVAGEFTPRSSFGGGGFGQDPSGSNES